MLSLKYLRVILAGCCCCCCWLREGRLGLVIPPTEVKTCCFVSILDGEERELVAAVIVVGVVSRAAGIEVPFDFQVLLLSDGGKDGGGGIAVEVF